MNFSDQLVNLSSAELAAGAARLDMRGTFTHPHDSFDTGHVQLYLASNDVQLAQLKTLQKQRPGLAGLIHLNTDARVGGVTPLAVRTARPPPRGSPSAQSKFIYSVKPLRLRVTPSWQRGRGSPLERPRTPAAARESEGIHI